MLVYQSGLLINEDYGKNFVDCYNNQVICGKNFVDCHNNSQVVCGKNFADCHNNSQVIQDHDPGLLINGDCGNNFVDGYNNQVKFDFVDCHNQVVHDHHDPCFMNNISGLNPEAKPFMFLRKKVKKKNKGLNPDAKPFEHSNKTTHDPNAGGPFSSSVANSLNPNAAPFESTTFGYANTFKYEVPCMMSDETSTAKIYDLGTNEDISETGYNYYEDQISPLNPNAVPYDPPMLQAAEQHKRPNFCPLMRSTNATTTTAPATTATPNCQALNVGSYYNCYNITIYKYMKTGPSV